MIRRGSLLFVVSLLLVALAGACGSGGDSVKGAPSKDGEYTVKPGSISYDGDRYRLLWEDRDGQFRDLSGKGLKMVKDERTFLARSKGETVLHLREDEPIETLARDNNGNYSSPWFPFLVGAAVGNAFSGPRYHYPPTDTFGRGDQLNGSVVTQTAKPPKYEGLPPNPNAVSGQSQGTGGGNAVTNKAEGATVSGQSQGTGAGTAASAKGGFRSGDQSFERRASRPSVGAGGSQAEPGRAAPKKPVGAGGSKGGSRGGGRSGGRGGGK